MVTNLCNMGDQIIQNNRGNNAFNKRIFPVSIKQGFKIPTSYNEGSKKETINDEKLKRDCEYVCFFRVQKP
jgi:hypothetical protein